MNSYSQHYLRMVMGLCIKAGTHIREWDADLRDYLLGKGTP